MKRLLSICLSLCVMMSVFVSFDITASAKTTMKNPTVTVSNSAKSIDVKWKKVSGAKSYKVYRKVAGAKKYSVVKSTNNKTVKYADKKVSAGKTYYYHVVAVNGKDKATSATKSIVRLLAPTNLKAVNYSSNTDCTMNFDDYDYDYEDSVEGVKLTWTKSKGANKYDIYRKIGKGKYVKIKTTGNVSSYVDEELMFYDVETCYYKIVAKKNNSQSASSAVKKIVYIAFPYISATSVSSGMQVEWANYDNCDGYKLYRSPNGKKGTYSLISKQEKSSYIDKKVSLNKTYYYKVVAYKGSYNSSEAIVKMKYQALMTIDVKEGKTNDTIKTYIKKAIKELGDDITMEEYMKMLKITSLNSKIATISDDYVITGVSKGSTKAKMEVKIDSYKMELGFIIINVK